MVRQNGKKRKNDNKINMFTMIAELAFDYFRPGIIFETKTVFNKPEAFQE
jgi:hypothetical protein